MLIITVGKFVLALLLLLSCLLYTSENLFWLCYCFWVVLKLSVKVCRKLPAASCMIFYKFIPPHPLSLIHISRLSHSEWQVIFHTVTFHTPAVPYAPFMFCSEWLQSVSYTHLDVYKRQWSHRPHGLPYNRFATETVPHGRHKSYWRKVAQGLYNRAHIITKYFII